MAKKYLVVELKVGQSLSIDSGRIVLTIADKSGQRIKAKFEVDEDVHVQHPRNSAKTGAAQALNGIKVTAPA